MPESSITQNRPAGERKPRAAITWLGQMGLRIEIGATTVFVDYFASDLEGRRTPAPIPAKEVRGVDAFLGTHDHIDHIDHEAWRIWAKTCPDAKFVFPSMHRQAVLNDGVAEEQLLPIDAGGSVRVGEVTIHAIPSAHEFLSPDAQGRYPCLQYVIEGGGARIYHAGDTVRYEGMLPLLKAFGPIDAALIPINGRDGRRYRAGFIGNMTFQEAVDLAGELRPALALPGHWDMFADNPGDPEAFADYLDAKYPGLVRCRIPRPMEVVELWFTRPIPHPSRKRGIPMAKSKVYFSDFRTRLGVNQGMKLQKLCRAAGIADIDFDGKFVAIKMHFGELGNFSYLRPNYVKAVADLVKELGGKPFLTDCNTLYPGSRKNAVDHLTNAELNGFNSVTTGCHVIIADGLRGTDDIEVPVPNGEYCQTALIGRALMDADILISLSHFKGHEMTGFGGAIKNIGMGGGSRAGKMHQHSEGTPRVDRELCRGCGRCARECGSDAISYGEDRKAFIDPDLCKGCGRCIGACAFDAISNMNGSATEHLCCKMAEYTAAICQGRPCFHISLIMDVSPNCDCHDENDAPILPNIGMLASFDPVALDQACADLCQQAEPIRNSQLGDNLAQPGWHHHHDHFLDSNPNVRWKETLAHGEKIGLGTRDYELVTIK